MQGVSEMIEIESLIYRSNLTAKSKSKVDKAFTAKDLDFFASNTNEIRTKIIQDKI